MSFTVYTLDELDRREGPPSARFSRAGFDDVSRRRRFTHFHRVGVAIHAFALAFVAWRKMKGLRPSARLTLREPFDTLGDALQAAVDAIDWKKLGVITGIVIGASLTSLFAVLTVAELTDDLRPPGSPSHLASTEPSGAPHVSVSSRMEATTNLSAPGALPVTAGTVAASPVTAPSPAAPVLTPPGVAPPTLEGAAPAAMQSGAAEVTAFVEIDGADDPAPTPFAASAAAARKAAAAKGRGKPVFRNADVIFNP